MSIGDKEIMGLNGDQTAKDVIATTTENLEKLWTEVSSNTVENLDSLSIYELYDKFCNLKEKLPDIFNNIRRMYKIDELELYLNNIAPDEEKLEVQKKIDKYKAEIEADDNETSRLKGEMNVIELEFEKRYSEINDLFFKVFDLIHSDGNWKDSGWSGITRTVVKENWEEIWKEISVEHLFWIKHLFRDNDGKFYFYITEENTGEWMDENTGEWMGKDKEIAALKDVFPFLKRLNENITAENDDIEAEDEAGLGTVTSENENKGFEEPEIEIDDLVDFSDYCWIDMGLINEFINIIKKSDKIPNVLDEDLKKELWFESVESEISFSKWCIFFYIKKYCPNKYKEILPFMSKIFEGAEDVNYGVVKRVIWSIKFYWDSAYEYLRFCLPFDGSYLKEWVSHLHGKYFWETLDGMKQRYEKEMSKNLDSDEKDGFSGLMALMKENSHDEKEDTSSKIDLRIKETQDMFENIGMLNQYFENFAQEPEAPNLFSFIKENPQKLNNLWWKEIKTIDLSLNSWINFAFRWILEMVKSRPDIDFPHLNENASESEKIEWKHQWEKIIREYETMLRNYIAKDKSKEKEKTFDKVFFSLSAWSLWFFSGDKDSDYMPPKNWVQQFSWNEVLDYSDSDNYSEWEEEKEKKKEIKMISDIEEYAKEHPDEKILVCVEHHGGSSWSSSNWWNKEDWIRLANISPNIKVWSIRCYFWAAYSNKDIYNYQSSLSWFSNSTSTAFSVIEPISEAWNKNLWFHEMEIYTRLIYPVSVAPLTENMEYKNRKTWKDEILKIGLAENDNQKADDLWVNYA